MFDDPRVAVDPAAIRGFTKDYEHGQVAFELFREATPFAPWLSAV